MKRLGKLLILAWAISGWQAEAEASGVGYRLSGYATAGASPAVTFIVTDSQGNGVRGAAVNITCTVGILDIVSGSTAADGTLTVRQSSGEIGNTITATCAVTVGSPCAVIASASRNVAATDTVVAWFDESRRLANAAVVISQTKVLTATSSFAFTATDTTSDGNLKNITLGQSLAQTTSSPAQVEVWQGTYNSGDYITVDESTVNGANNGTVTFSSNQPTRFLNAYAVDAANPTVCAVVTDFNGVGISGVAVNAACTAGNFAIASTVTNDNGMACFYQEGGSLGDTLTVSCPSLPATSSVKMITDNTRVLANTDKVFAWYERKTRKINSAYVTRATNVLAASVLGSSITNSPRDVNAPSNFTPVMSTFISQIATRPALSQLAYGTSEVNDLIRFRQATLTCTPAYGGNNFHAIIQVPANESQYLLAFATGGINPTVWAVVTDYAGNAVSGLSGANVNFTMEGSGSIPGSATTSWNGMANVDVTGAASLGNTITVAAAGLGEIKIYTANSQAAANTDRVYGWYASETHKVFGAVVTYLNNILTSSGTAMTPAVADNSSGNNLISISSFSPQTQVLPALAHIGMGTVESGDIIRMNKSAFPLNYDTQIVAQGDSAKYLLAFAKGGANPEVWAVVIDSQGNGLENEAVTFSTTGGTLNSGMSGPVNVNTGYGGFYRLMNNVVSLGNTITVSASGLPPTDIVLSNSVAVANYDWGYAWYDASRLTLWGIMVSQITNVIVADGSSSYTTPVPASIWDNSSNNRSFAVNAGTGHLSTRAAYPLNQWNISFGTAGAGDEVALNVGTTTNNPDVFIRLSEVRNRFLRAYASPGVSCSLKAILVDADANGLPNENIAFSTNGGSLGSAGPWRTGLDGSVAESKSGGALGNIITVSASGCPAAYITNDNSGGIQTYSQAVIWYSPQIRRLNTMVIQNPSFNIMPTGTGFGVTYSKIDLTRPFTEPKVTLPDPVYSFVCLGASSAGDVIQVKLAGTSANYDGMFTLPADAGRYLQVFAPGGDNPTIWAIVTDAQGNGISDVPVNFSTATGTFWGSLTNFNTPTAPSGVTRVAYTGLAGGTITISAEGVGDTKTVTTSLASPIDAYCITESWNDVPARTIYAAFVNIPQNILAQGAGINAAFNSLDGTQLNPLVPQTDTVPSYAVMVDGTQSTGDRISIGEATATADPDALVTIYVPNALLSSNLTASPDPVINGQFITLSMAVANSGSSDAQNVSPTAVNVAGGAEWVSGPVPDYYALITPTASQEFIWMYRATAPGGVTFTAQAIGIDSYTTLNITTTVKDSNPVLVRNPHPPVLSALLAASPGSLLTQGYIYVTMTVTNNSDTDVPNPLNVSPTALSLAGSAAWVSGPTPENYDIPRGGQHDFVWQYQATAPTGVTFTGQAYTLNPFDYSGVTSSAVNAYVAVRNPHSPVLVSSLTAGPGFASIGQWVAVTMTVTNSSDAEVPADLTVTPSALTLSGGAILNSGPVPAADVIPRAESRNFIWTYTANAAGMLHFTGQAYTTNPFDFSGVTSTATSSNDITVQTPASLSATLSGPNNAERLRDFTLSMTVQNTGQAMAISVTPVNLTWDSQGSDATMTYISGSLPALANIPGGNSQTFTWTCSAGNSLGAGCFAAQAQGYDANRAVPVTAALTTSNIIQVIQGALCLDRITSPVVDVYRGQRGLEVMMHCRNTSVMGVTLTAMSLNFNQSQAGFAVLPAVGNPAFVEPESSFELGFTVTVNKNAPLGAVEINGAIAGDSPNGAMSANGAQQRAAWNVLEAFNSLRQNYPNPLRLSRSDRTTLEYYVKEDTAVTIKIYNLAGELVKVLVDGSPGVGHYSALWYGDNGSVGERGKTVGSGVYIAVFKSGDYQEMKKVVVIR